MTKNKKKNIAFKICSLFVMALLCIISFVVPTKAYYQDENGNLISQNLFENEFNYSSANFSITTINQTTTINGVNNNVTFLEKSVYLESGNYFLSIQNSTDNNNTGLSVFVEIQNVRYDSNFTISTSGNYSVFMRVELYSSVNYSFNIMLNKGSTSLTYEPYGNYYSQTNYDNNGTIQYGQGYREGKNEVYDSLTYQNISRLVNNVALAKYDTANETFINRPNINSVSYENNDLVVAWSTSSSDNNYWYHLVLSWSTNSLIKDVGFTPSRFSNVILDINGYQMSNVNYNGSYFGFFGINEHYNTPCNTLTLMFKLNNGSNFENVHINIQGFNENIQIASEQYNEGYEQGVSVGKAEGYSTGYSEGVNQATQNVIGWKGLFFSMADLPFKTVSNFLGFEVLGVNLFKAFIGFITVLGILWVFKRLVK